MCDPLVKLFNRFGYTPMYLPRTRVTPPELYNAKNGKLIRHGPLWPCLPRKHRNFPREKGESPDLEQEITAGKNLSGAVDFLESALRCIGVGGNASINLGFAKGKKLVFSFGGVTYKGVAPVHIERRLRHLRFPGIPKRHIYGQRLHIVYEYIYAGRLLMAEAGGRAFQIGGRAGITRFIDLGGAGKVALKGGTVVSFSSTSDTPAAIAYKAARLDWNEDQLEFVVGGAPVTTPDEGPSPYIPRPGMVFDVRKVPLSRIRRRRKN